MRGLPDLPQLAEIPGVVRNRAGDLYWAPVGAFFALTATFVEHQIRWSEQGEPDAAEPSELQAELPANSPAVARSCAGRARKQAL